MEDMKQLCAIVMERGSSATAEPCGQEEFDLHEDFRMRRFWPPGALVAMVHP